MQHSSPADDLPSSSSLATAECSPPPSKSPLCHRCRQLDLVGGRSVKLGVNGEMFASLGEISASVPASHCALCRLFASIRMPLKPLSPYASKVSKTQRGYHLRVFDGSTSLWKETRGSAKSKARKIVPIFGVARGLSPKTFGIEDRLHCLAQGVIAPVASSEPHHVNDFRVKLVDPYEADFTTIARWLDQCKTFHTDTCTVERIQHKTLFELTCIDCFNRNIVRLEPYQSYFALSYVWGNAAQVDQHLRPAQESLSSVTLPEVIEDAMLAVQRLGGQFLWVDRYCINQVDATKRHTQIQNMDLIYENAFATIVAASGNDDRASLPGLGRASRTCQLSATIHDQTFASTLPSLSVSLANSPWMSRAWTYQEAILSLRCIYFTKEQVYFTCRAMTRSEAIPQLTTIPPKSKPNGIQASTDPFDLKYRSRGREKKGLWQFFDHLHYYKARSLTYDSDALNAFQGILSTLHVWTIWGIPIADISKSQLPSDDTDFDMGFARGLMWENPPDPYWDTMGTDEVFRPFRRCSGFPSWSWAGWAGSIRQCFRKTVTDYASSTKCNAAEHTKSSPRFWVENSGRRLTLREVCVHALSQQGEMPELSQTLYVEAEIYTVKLYHRAKSNSNNIFCTKASGVLFPIRIFQDRATDTRFDETALSGTEWDALILFNRQNRNSYAVLILDWQDNKASVIGSGFIHLLTLREFPSRREIVNLI